MSDLGTRIIGAGLVEDGIEVERIEKQLADIKEAVSGRNPVCPLCFQAMSQVNFTGYYDSFSYWECGCQSFPDGRRVRGEYA